MRAIVQNKTRGNIPGVTIPEAVGRGNSNSGYIPEGFICTIARNDSHYLFYYIPLVSEQPKLEKLAKFEKQKISS